MSTEARQADPAPSASPAGSASPQLEEALRRALLRSLCHKMHSVWDRQQIYNAPYRRMDCSDVLAEMIGDMVGLTAEKVYLVFDDACDSGEHVGDRLIEELEPLLARGSGSWMTEGCL
jgi:hypothetical protein